MTVNYRIHRLDGLIEVPLDNVDFETTERCPVCQSHRLSDVAVLDQSLISAWCEDCCHLFHRKRPASSWYHDWYHSNWDSEGKEANADRPPLSKRLKQSIKHKLGIFARRGVYDFCGDVVAKGSQVLDIGCGYGAELIPFVQKGCKAYGIEASPHRAAAAERVGVRTAAVRVEKLNEGTFGTRFDLVFANHVLEHVVDPHEFLTALEKVVKPNGYICISVPNFSQDFLLQQFFFALHIHCFSMQSMTTLLKSHGFDVHRDLQQHQIRVLAQMGTAQPAKAASPDKQREKLQASRLIKRCFGDTMQGDDVHPNMFCEWARLPKEKRTAEQLYEVHYGPQRSLKEKGKRLVMEVSFEGDGELPLHFKKKAPGVPASFWVK